MGQNKALEPALCRGSDPGFAPEIYVSFRFPWNISGGFDNIFETETWYFLGNMRVLLRNLDWGLGTKDLHSDPADKTFLGLHIVNNVSNWSNL